MRSYFLYFFKFYFSFHQHYTSLCVLYICLDYLILSSSLSSLHKLRRKITIVVGYTRETTQTSHHQTANEFEEKYEIKNRKFYFENKTRIISEKEKSHIQANRGTHGM